MQHVPMYMHDWITELDDFATRYGQGVLPGPGSVSHDDAVQHATNEYEEYLKHLASEPSPAELDYLEAITAAQRQIEKRPRRPPTEPGAAEWRVGETPRTSKGPSAVNVADPHDQGQARVMEVTTLDAERLVRVAGLRATRSRTAVLAAVHAHPLAGTSVIVDAARRKLTDLSRRAVQDSLRALVDVGLVRRFQAGSVVRFEARVSDHLRVDPPGPVTERPSRAQQEPAALGAGGSISCTGSQFSPPSESVLTALWAGLELLPD